MVVTVSSLGSGLRPVWPRVRAGPKELLSSPTPPGREGIGHEAGPGGAEEVLTGSKMR